MTDALMVFGVSVSPWVYAPVLLVIWLVVALTVKGLVFRGLVVRAGRTGNAPLRAVTQTLSAPLMLVIVLIGVWGLEMLLPMHAAVDRVMNITARVLLVLTALVFFDRFINQLLLHFKDRFAYVDITRGIVRGVLRLLILSIGALVLLDTLGVSITPLIASLGVGSLAVALALQAPLSNLFAGLFVLGDRTVRVGDYIKLDTGEEGYVTNIGWRHTRIRTLTNIGILIPNSRLNSSVIQNMNLPQQDVAMFFPVGVSYASDLRRVEQVTLEVAREVQNSVPGAVRGFESIVRYHTFGESSIQFNVMLRAQDFGSTYLVKHEFIKALHERYHREGIIIPFPIRTLDIPDSLAQRLGPDRH